MNEFIAAATVVVTAVGVWFAHNYRRQVALKLSETRLQAYSRLWEISGLAAPTRLDGWGDDGYLALEERRKLWAAMTDWYYAKGGGMLLTATSKDVYLKVKHNLICKSSSDLRPAGLADLIDSELGLLAGCELDEKVRGTLAIRLISLLRTQLKSDLAIYGATYSGELAEYECLFLEQSDVDLASKAWARAARLDTPWRRWQWRWRQWRKRRRAALAQRRRAALAQRRRAALAQKSPNVKPHISPTEPLPQPSPLQGMSPSLKVEGMARTPRSSDIAVSNALKGSGGSARAQVETD